MTAGREFFLSLVVATLALALATAADAGTFVAFGPQQFTRSTAAPAVETVTFSVRNPATSYTLHVEQNGVSSAVVTLNGATIFGPHDFNQQVAELSAPVMLLGTNTIGIELRGGPGESLNIRVSGVDEDAPRIVATAEPAPNAAGWNATEVTVTFDCSDVTSAIASCPPPRVVANEGANQQITGTALDEAGNSATATVALNIDRSAPRITITSPADGSVVTMTSVVVSGTVDDAISGASEVSCGTGSVPVVEGAFLCAVTLAPGANDLSFRATDLAGNEATAALRLQLAAGPTVRITEPANLAFVNLSPITIRGTVSAGATVKVSGIDAPVSSGAFSVQVPLVEGNNTITAVAETAGGVAATAAVQVTLDTTPPHLAIHAPAEGHETPDASITVSGLINDVVVGTVNEEQAQVTVNGQAAEVANRSFLAREVPLAPGDNVIRAVGRDRVGNSYSTAITVRRIAAAGARIRGVSGDGQSAGVGSPLPQPLVVELIDTSGAPAADRTVVFKVTQSDGTLLDPSGDPKGSIVVRTDAAGRAEAEWVLGFRAGAGNNRVEATATGFGGTALFAANATPSAPAGLHLDAGSGQTGAVGQPLPFPFVVVVTDAGHNRLNGVPVLFAVKAGGGSFGEGATTRQTVTDSDGRALAVLTLGPESGYDNNVVEATTPGSAIPVVFGASARYAGAAADTKIAGTVLDNSNLPLPGATVRLYQAYQASNSNIPIPIGTPVVTDDEGQFVIAPAPVGAFKLVADGTTIQRGSAAYPSVEYDIVTVAGQINTVGMPVYLPALDTVNRLCVSPTAGGTLTVPSVPGLALTVEPGAATFPGGSRTGCITVTPVNGDKVPMVPGFGQQPRFVITIQPAGTHFSPPAQLAMPNVDGLAPRQVTEMYSYDHDLSTFVAIGTGTVSADGSVIRSDPGVGVLKAGWHCGGNPNPTGAAATCPECKKCVTKQCVADAAKDAQVCQNDHCKECRTGNCVDANVTVTITDPPDNPNPPDLADNFSFLARRSFSGTASSDEITATATLTPAKDASEIEWTITPAVGSVRQVTPADRKGPTVSFVPDPAAHPAYDRGSNCGSPGNGNCARSTALSYKIKAEWCAFEDENTITQDQVDIIRQEYANHGITIPERGDFNAVAPTTHYTVANINTTSYSIILGTPGTLAQNVRNELNRRIHDDEQLRPVGTGGLASTTPIVGPGDAIQTIGAVRTTPRCHNAPNPATCDDVVSGNNILAGPNGIAETEARNLVTNVHPRINSTWRNPERNEAVGGVLNSFHQYGDAVDLDILAAAEGLTTAQLFCLLQTAADEAGYNGFAEHLSSQRACNAADVTHVHVQPQ